MNDADGSQYDEASMTWLTTSVRGDDGDVQSTLDAIVRTAVTLINSAQYASINLMIRGRFSPQAALGDPPRRLDELQQQTGEGPCIVASETQRVVHVPDTASDTPWPAYARRAVGLDVRSMLCVPLAAGDTRLGSLSLYSVRRRAFDERTEKLAALLATQAAFALSDAQRATNLRLVAHNRDLIGMAKGILMERLHISPDEAFELLSQASQRANARLVSVAEQLVQSGRLPSPTVER